MAKRFGPKTGDTSWFISEDGEVEEGRMIVLDYQSCYLHIATGKVHFSEPNSSFHSEKDARSELLYREKIAKKKNSDN